MGRSPVFELVRRYKEAAEHFYASADPAGLPDVSPEWIAMEQAELAMVREPCQSEDEVQAKVQLALEDENIFDSLANCTVNGEPELKIFLRSLLGA